MQFFPIHTRLIKPEEDYLEIIFEAMKTQSLTFEDGDILILSEKVVATSEGRIVNLNEVKVSARAKELAKKYYVDERTVELVLQEADEVLSGVPRILLTLKNNMLMPNAGIDHSNAPANHVILLPKDPWNSAEKARSKIMKRFGKRIGVLIMDSRVMPMRMGTIGLALGVAGFEPMEDIRGRNDLYGKMLLVTLRAVADDLASAAQLVMGEANESNPAILVRGAPVMMTDRPIKRDSMYIPPDECLYIRGFERWNWGKKERNKKMP